MINPLESLSRAKRFERRTAGHPGLRREKNEHFLFRKTGKSIAQPADKKNRHDQGEDPIEMGKKFISQT
jgi:hypothetical protein